VAAARHRSFEHRARVDLAAHPDALSLALSALMARVPTDRVALRGLLALTYRREPPWFLAVASVALLLLGLLGHLTSARGGHLLAAVLEMTSVLAIATLWFSLRWRAEFAAEGGEMVVREWLGRRALREQRVRAEEITAVLVVGEPGRRRVVLVGARNLELCLAYEEAFMDPPSLARWLADALALLASHAACAPPVAG
jgi:hypothetical protein